MPPAWPEPAGERLRRGAERGEDPSGLDAAQAGGRRFLIAGAVSRYCHAPSWDREELAEDLDRIVELFTGELGYQHVPWLGLDPHRSQIQDVLRDFCTAAGRRPDDYLAVYLAGHGTVLQVGTASAEHAFLPADATPADLRRRVIKTADLAEWILAGTEVRRLLLMLDACYSGQGGLDFTQSAATWTGNPGRAGWPGGSGMVVVSATQPWQQSVAGAFSAAFARAVRLRSAAADDPDGLAIDAVINAVNDDQQLPPTQRAAWSLVLGNGAIPDFLPGPGPGQPHGDPGLARQLESWRRRRAEEDRRAEEMRLHFAPRAAGFTGRRRALARICRWIAADPDSRALVVTSDPGSGKTAVLGLLAVLGDPRHRPGMPLDDLPAGIVSGAASIGVAIHAAGLSAGQVLAGLAAAAGLDPDPAEADLGVARLIAGLRRRDQPLIAIIDAADEAAHPDRLAGDVLGPLIEYGGGSIRLVLGMRRHACPRLGPAWPRGCAVTDLDAPEYADPEGLAELARRVLREDQDGAPSPFARCSPAVLAAAVSAIAGAAGQSFLVARLLAAAQAACPALPDVASPGWRAGLPGQAGETMMGDLRSRLGSDAARAADLLRPLAYARGPGLPWEDIWPLAATALAGHRYTSEDLVWLADHAGSYVTASGTIAGRPAYRLFHESLAGSLRAGRDQQADEDAIARALAGHVPCRAGGQPRWDKAHPYTRAHLASHAASGGGIDALAQDPEFLLAADPPQLLAALGRVSGPAARAAAGAYRHARPFLRRSPRADHAAYLALAAHCENAPGLAARIAADRTDGSWRPLWAAWQPRQRDQEIGGHDGPVTSIAVAEADGCPVIASGGADGTVRLWDLRTGIPASDPLTGHAGTVRSLAAGLLHGRPVIISGGDDGTVRAWDLGTGQPASDPLTGHAGAVRSVTAATAGGRLIVVSGGIDGTVRRWDLAAGAPLGEPLAVSSSWIMTVAVTNADGQPVIACGTETGSVHVLDLATGKPASEPAAGSGGPACAMAVADLDGQPALVTASEDGTMRLTDLATGRPAGGPLAGHRSWVAAVAAGRIGGRAVLASGGSDCMVRIWDLAEGTPCGGPLTGHGGSVNAVAITSLDSRPAVISGSDDGTVRIWDPAGSRRTRHEGAVSAVATGVRDGRPVVISGSSDCTVRFWDMVTGQPAGEPMAGHGGRVRAVASAVRGGRPVVVSGSDDATIMIWDMATGKPAGKPLAGHAGAVTSVATAVLHGRPVVVSGSDDATIMIWDMATGQPLGKPLAAHAGAVTSVATAVLHGRPVIVSGSSDATIMIWDMATSRLSGKPLAGHSGWVLAVTVTELAGRPVVISAGDDGTVRTWDPATGQPAGPPVISHDSAIYCLAAADLDGRPGVIAGSDDETVLIWDLAAGRLAGAPLAGHSSWVLAVAAGSLDDGRAVVVSGSSDETIRTWDLAAMTALGQDAGRHCGAVNAIALAGGHDGEAIVVSGSSDKTLRSWGADSGTAAGGPMTGHAGAVRSVATGLLGARQVAVSGSDDGTARAWDLATGHPVGRPACHDSRTLAVATAERDGRPVIISGSDSGTGHPGDLAAGYPVSEVLTASAGSVRAVAVTQLKDGPAFATGGANGIIRLWNLATGEAAGKAMAGHDGAITALAHAPLRGRPVIISATARGIIRTWDPATARAAGKPMAGHDGAITALAPARLRGRPVIICATARGIIRTWDLATGEPVGEPFPGVGGRVTSMAALQVPGSPGKPGGAWPAILVGTGSQVTVLGFSPAPGASSWRILGSHRLPSRVLAVTWNRPGTFIAGTERGIVAIETSWH